MQDLENALKLIKEECMKHNVCRSCPLRKHGEDKCYVGTYTPENWQIKSNVSNASDGIFM